MRDNYVTQVAMAARSFAALDHAQIARTYGLSADGRGLQVAFLNRLYFISADGTMTDEAGAPAPFGVAMTLYDALSRPEKAPLAGRWCSQNAFNAVRGGTLQSRLTLSDDGLAAPYAEDPSSLERACIAVGGKRVQGGGDLCFELPLLPWMPILLRFWEADDEFPAQLQLMWDANMTQFIHYETSWYAVGAIQARLTEETGGR